VYPHRQWAGNKPRGKSLGNCRTQGGRDDHDRNPHRVRGRCLVGLCRRRYRYDSLGTQTAACGRMEPAALGPSYVPANRRPDDSRHHARQAACGCLPRRASPTTMRRSSTRLSGPVKCACHRSGRRWSARSAAPSAPISGRTGGEIEAWGARWRVGASPRWKKVRKRIYWMICGSNREEIDCLPMAHWI
jgi:hypothetical protein